MTTDTTARETTTTTGTASDEGARRTLTAIGGRAAQVVAGTYVIGFAAMAAYLMPRGYASPVGDPSGSLSFLRDHQVEMNVWYLVLYLLGGAAMALVALGVGARLAASPVLARISTAFGLIWSGLLIASGSIALVGQSAAVELYADDPELALNAWVSTSIVQNALGGGVEVAGAFWALIVGYAALRTRALSAGLGGLALGLGVVGAGTVIPAAAELNTSIFGIGFIVWFTWLGISLRRDA